MSIVPGMQTSLDKITAKTRLDRIRIEVHDEYCNVEILNNNNSTKKTLLHCFQAIFFISCLSVILTKNANLFTTSSECVKKKFHL